MNPEPGHRATEITPGEHDDSPPHLQLTQEAEPDFSAWQEPNGSGCHGFHSHLHDRDELAKDIACYYGMISCMDKYIGQIIDHLDALGLAENTLVVFTSDHGHYFGQHGLIAKGAFHYEDGLRVPMIARLPGRIPADHVSHSLQSLVDYAPTFLDYCGLDVPVAMTGLSQKQIWGRAGTDPSNGDESKARQHVIIENRHQPTTLHLKTMITERYKITLYYNRDYGEIYDLADEGRVDDPGPDEVDNLWSDAELRAQLTEAFLRAEMMKEEPLTDGPPSWGDASAICRTSQRRCTSKAAICVSSKSTSIRMRIATNSSTWHLRVDTAPSPGCTSNLWDDPAHREVRAEMVRALLFSRWGLEPLWMPRVSGA